MTMKKTIWVLGAGQLGAMLQEAGKSLELDVRPVDINESSAPFVHANDLVTAEREQWPDTLVTQTLAQHPLFINRHIFSRLADRKTQKELIDSLSLATAPWRNVVGDINANELCSQLGVPVLLKRRTGGYDGKGQYWLRTEDDQVPNDWQGEAIAEKAIAFDEEISLVGVRNRAGDCAFYPLTLNLHLNGILYASIAPLGRVAHLQTQAETMLGKLLNALNYVGVMAMECFRVGDQLLINELAPRVHNSGHWTQAGANISQFEYHLRAIADMVILKPQVVGHTVMINLVGTPYDAHWLSLPNARVYWYGKEVRSGRKVGHINITGMSLDDLIVTLNRLKKMLPESYYSEAMGWCLKALTNL
jgi:5-(carboxyamino)imidazole ribonucleotide synthase